MELMADDKLSRKATASSDKGEDDAGLPAELPSSEAMELASNGESEGPLSDWLPSRAPSGHLRIPPPHNLTRLEPGQQLGDFLIRRVIGRGGFAAVYLALQLSLDREVALKVTCPEALLPGANDPTRLRGEGQHLAQLDHPNIVGVFQQSIEPHTGAQLLSVQYICGTTLGDVIDRLRDRAGNWSGRDFLEVIDNLPMPPPRLDTAALVDRQTLENADHVETICRLGRQLASALEHAHRRSVFHRDVKPANVLVNRYGRPFLADFNLATAGGSVDQPALAGGTLSYMAPEHLESFITKTPLPKADHQRLGDIYSLGVLLWQTTTGQLPFLDSQNLQSDIDRSERISRLVRRRQQLPVDQWAGNGVFQTQPTRIDSPNHLKSSAADRTPAAQASYHMLADVIAKCMQAKSQRRYQSAGAVCRALDGLIDLHTARRGLVTQGPVWAAIEQHPVAAVFIAGLLPQVTASGLQIAYNTTQVVGSFDPAQSAAFVQVIYWANPLIYGSCLLIFFYFYGQILPVWQSLQARTGILNSRTVSQARRRLLRLPWRTSAIAGCGWLAGAILFPSGVMLLGGPLPGVVLLHFLMSFLLAGLISVTYSALGIAAIVLRVYYPRFWLTPNRFRWRARAELRSLDKRLNRITLLAGSIPLAAAAALILVQPTAGGAASMGLRVLVVLLIIAGGIGYFQAGSAVTSLRRMIYNWLSDNGRKA